MLANPLETQTIDLAVAISSNDPEDATAMLFRIHLLKAYVNVMKQSPETIDDPLLRVIVRLSDESTYWKSGDDTTWFVLFEILRENGPRKFASWVNLNRHHFWQDNDLAEVGALVYENSEGEIVQRFPDLQERVKDLGEYSKRALERVEATPSSGATKQSGCYVATYVYGTYDCPELWVLRRWRDEYLAQSILGRALIRIYYAVSPQLIRYVGGGRLFAFGATRTVAWVVARLQRAGVSNSRYNAQ